MLATLSIGKMDRIHHPADERSAAWFHGMMALIGVCHILGGLAMLWFHGVSAIKHEADHRLETHNAGK